MIWCLTVAFMIVHETKCWALSRNLFPPTTWNSACERKQVKVISLELLSSNWGSKLYDKSFSVFLLLRFLKQLMVVCIFTNNSKTYLVKIVTKFILETFQLCKICDCGRGLDEKTGIITATRGQDFAQVIWDKQKWLHAAEVGIIHLGIWSVGDSWLPHLRVNIYSKTIRGNLF